MIKRNYFIVVEIKPQYYQEQFDKGLPVIGTGILAHNSVFADPDQAVADAHKLIIDQVPSFTTENTIVTNFTRC
jgi:hypothetical protein